MTASTAFYLAFFGILLLAFGELLLSYKNRRDLRIFERLRDEHLHLIEKQLQLQLDATEEKRKSEHRERAYALLSQWLYELDRTVDELWFGCTTENQSIRNRAKFLIDRWPWDTLRVPADVASAAIYWSKGVHDRIGSFESTTVALTSLAALAIRTRQGDGPAQDENSLWKARLESKAAIADIRLAAREDIESRRDR